MGNALPPRASSKQIEVEVEFVTLPKGENHERIQRLARKILRVLEDNCSKSRRHSPQGKSTPAEKDLEEYFASNLESKLGI